MKTNSEPMALKMSTQKLPTNLLETNNFLSLKKLRNLTKDFFILTNITKNSAADLRKKKKRIPMMRTKRLLLLLKEAEKGFL